jgi:hypothetical protein
LYALIKAVCAHNKYQNEHCILLPLSHFFIDTAIRGVEEKGKEKSVIGKESK